ncbi:MAG: hypothetical protein ACLFPV_02810 [Spirochaetaceae bacterium]
MKSVVKLAVLIGLLVVGLGRIGAVGAAEEPLGASRDDGSLSLASVDLYTGGVGLFRFEGDLEAGETVELRLPREHVPDVLKSLLIQGADGSAVPVLSFDTADRIERRLQGNFLDLSGSPDRAALLQRLRGERVSLIGPASATGRIVALEERPVDEGRRELFLTLFGEDGLQEVSLADVDRIVFADENLNSEFEGLLRVLREARIDQERVLRLRVGSGYAGPVTVSYLHEAPVWKTSYRLVLGSTGEYRLQAWGHVDNTTAIPWRNVEVTLVSSRPVAFRMDLLTPLHADRPTLAPPQATVLAPRTFSEMEAAPAPAPAPEAEAYPSRRAFDEALGEAETPGAAGATASAIPTAVRYRIVAEVELPPGSGAMLPIFDTRIPGRRVSLYRRDDGTTPRAGVEVTNETGLALLAGPVTVLESGSFVGDALTSDLAAGESTILTYALDSDTTVLTEAQSEPETISSVRIADGMLIARRLRSLRTVYRYEHHGERLGTLVIEHPKQPGWEVVGGPGPASESESFLRFEVPLTGVSDRLEIVEEQPVSTSVALDRLTTDQISFYLSRPVIDAETADTLRGLSEILTRLSETDRELGTTSREIDALFRDQERIRSNLEAVPEGSDLADRYLSNLRRQEDQIEALRNRQAALEERRNELESRLARLVRGAGR